MASTATPSDAVPDGIVIRPATYDDIETLQEIETLARSTFTEHNPNLQEIAEQGPYPKSGHEWAIDNALTLVALMDVGTASVVDDEPQDVGSEDYDGDNDGEGGGGEPEDDRMAFSTKTHTCRYNLRNRKDEINKRARSPSPDHGPNKRKKTVSQIPYDLRSRSSKRLERPLLRERNINVSPLMEGIEMKHKGFKFGDRPHKNPNADLKPVSNASPTTFKFSRLSVGSSSAVVPVPTTEEEIESGISSPLSSINTEEMKILESEAVVCLGMAFSRQDPPLPCSDPPFVEGMDSQMEGMDIDTPQLDDAQTNISDETISNSRKTIVGFLTVVPMKSCTSGTVIHVELLMVGTNQQQKGIGGVLLKTLTTIVDSHIPEPFKSKLSTTQRRRLGKWHRKRLSLLTYDVPWGTQFYERNGFQKVPHAYNMGPDEMPRKLRNNLDFHHLNTLAADARPAGSDPVPESALWCLVRNWRGR